jgi:hypothetical protein
MSIYSAYMQYVARSLRPVGCGPWGRGAAQTPAPTPNCELRAVPKRRGEFELFWLLTDLPATWITSFVLGGPWPLASAEVFFSFAAGCLALGLLLPLETGRENTPSLQSRLVDLVGSNMPQKHPTG